MASRKVKIMWCVNVTESQFEKHYEYEGLVGEIGGNGITGEDLMFFVGVEEGSVSVYVDDCMPLNFPRKIVNSEVLNEFIKKHNIINEPKWWLITETF